MIIRQATEGDAEAVAAIYRPYVESTVISFEVEPPTAEQMRERMVRVLQTHQWLVAVDDDEVRGYAYASPHRERAAYGWSVDTAIYLHQRAHRRGIGRALYVALFARLEEQGFVNAFAGITLPNAASVGLHEALGFEPVGVYRHVGFKMGQWHDVGWWHRQLRPLPVEPVRPAPPTWGAP